ncbi:hypothetical protein Taro_046379, partial [Colocasia esculenta]|nr:hypothetical protein [Colocasia esculenta]
MLPFPLLLPFPLRVTPLVAHPNASAMDASAIGGWRGRLEDMDRILVIFTFKNDAYVIPMHRGMELCSVVNDVCRRWTLVKEQVELKCHIPEMSNSFMKLLIGEDIDRIIDMHEILGQKLINIDVNVSGSEEIVTFRASREQSSGKMGSPSQSLISPPAMRCMRGHGYCIVRTSKTERNPNRKFYTCMDAKCDFFMWCNEVQNFVDSQITCGKDENVNTLENRVARLEDERRDLNCIV